MRIRTKLLALALPVALLLPTACTGGGGDDRTLRILTNLTGSDPKGKALAAAVREFQQANAGVTVEVTDAPTPEEAHNRYEQAKLAGDEPDIVLTNLFGKPTAWLDNEATVDVAQYAKDWGLEARLLPEAIEQWKKPDGRLQGFPYEGFSWPVWYNTDLLEKAGVSKVPTTTDELITAAKKLRAAGIQPMATGGKDWSGNKLFSLVLETMVTDKQAIAAYRDGAWDTPQVKAGIELFTQLRDAGVFADQAQGLAVEDQLARFGGGKAAMMHAGSWEYGGDMPVLESGNVELGGFPLPADGVREKPVVYTAYTATGIWISPKGEQKLEGVEKFVKFLYTPEVLGSFVETGVHAPVPFDQVKVDESKLPKLYLQAIEKVPDNTATVVLSDTHIPTASQAGFERATSQAFTPGMSVDKIIGALEQAWQS